LIILENKGNASRLIICQTEEQQTKLGVPFEGEMVWLTQALMAGLFQTSTDNIGLHLKNIYAEGEKRDKYYPCIAMYGHIKLVEKENKHHGN